MILKKGYHSLHKRATLVSISVLFVLAHAVLLSMMLITFPRINDQLGTQAFDLKTFGYSYEEAVSMIQNLDSSTIDFYIFPQLFLLDILYPVLFALLLSTLIIRLLNLIGKESNSRYANLFVVPFIAMAMDYAENILIFVMLSSPTDISAGIVNTASFFTQMKGLVTTISWVIILVLFVIWITNKWKNKSVV